MKVLLSFLVLIFFFTNAQAQEIEATLGGNTSTDGFSVKDNGGNTLLRVGGDGNIGIGNFGNGDIHLTIKSSGGNTARNGIKFRNYDENYGWTIQNDERLVNDGLNFLSHFNDPDGVSRLFLSKFGNVGIGTTTPGNKLSVSGNTDFSGNVSIGTTDLAYGLWVKKSSDNIFAAAIENQSSTGWGL